MLYNDLLVENQKISFNKWIFRLNGYKKSSLWRLKSPFWVIVEIFQSQ